MISEAAWVKLPNIFGVRKAGYDSGKYELGSSRIRGKRSRGKLGVEWYVILLLVCTVTIEP